VYPGFLKIKKIKKKIKKVGNFLAAQTNLF